MGKREPENYSTINGEIFATVVDFLGLIQVEKDGRALEKVGSRCLLLRAGSKVSNIPFCLFFPFLE